MSEKKLRRLPLAAAALVACVSAQAEYQSPDGNFRMSGFGTLGAVKTTTDDAIFNYPGQGGGATKHGSLDPDSKIAVQGTYKFSPSVSATSQIMTKYDAEGQYVPGFEWAFAKWQAAPGLNFRVGRMGAPYFMISDFRDVGYANTAVRPNIDVYGQVPVSSFDGADVSYQMNLGDTTLTSTFWTGRSEAPFASALSTNGTPSEPTGVTINNTVGLNFQAELSEGVTLRFGRAQGKLTIDSAAGHTLAAGARQAAAGARQYAIAVPALAQSAQAHAAGFDSAADLFTPEGVDASFTGIGLAYDQDNWVASFEFTKRKTKSFITDTTAWYGTVGYRINKFTPFVGYSKVKTDRRSANPVVPGTLPGGGAINVATTQVSAGADVLLSTQARDQHTATLGMRWDATSGLAVKVQWDRIFKPASASSGNGSTGFFLVPDPYSASGQSFTYSSRKIDVLTLSVDFVF